MGYLQVSEEMCRGGELLVKVEEPAQAKPRCRTGSRAEEGVKRKMKMMAWKDKWEELVVVEQSRCKLFRGVECEETEKKVGRSGGLYSREKGVDT